MIGLLTNTKCHYVQYMTVDVNIKLTFQTYLNAKQYKTLSMQCQVQKQEKFYTFSFIIFKIQIFIAEFEFKARKMHSKWNKSKQLKRLVLIKWFLQLVWNVDFEKIYQISNFLCYYYRPNCLLSIHCTDCSSCDLISDQLHALILLCYAKGS